MNCTHLRAHNARKTGSYHKNDVIASLPNEWNAWDRAAALAMARFCFFGALTEVGFRTFLLAYVTICPFTAFVL